MAKKMNFAEKSKKRSDVHSCPVCGTPILYVKHVRAAKSDAGAWKFRDVNTGICKCNEAEAYA
jgi:hypothetical protein